MNHKILIIHGPNLNLLGIKSKKEGTTITLSKINTKLRKIASNQGGRTLPTKGPQSISDPSIFFFV